MSAIQDYGRATEAELHEFPIPKISDRFTSFSTAMISVDGDTLLIARIYLVDHTQTWLYYFMYNTTSLEKTASGKFLLAELTQADRVMHVVLWDEAIALDSENDQFYLFSSATQTLYCFERCSTPEPRIAFSTRFNLETPGRADLRWTFNGAAYDAPEQRIVLLGTSKTSDQHSVFIFSPVDGERLAVLELDVAFREFLTLAPPSTFFPFSRAKGHENMSFLQMDPVTSRPVVVLRGPLAQRRVQVFGVPSTQNVLAGATSPSFYREFAFPPVPFDDARPKPVCVVLTMADEYIISEHRVNQTTQVWYVREAGREPAIQSTLNIQVHNSYPVAVLPEHLVFVNAYNKSPVAVSMRRLRHHWIPQTHLLFPRDVRDPVRTMTALRLLDESIVSALPRELLYEIFRSL